MVENQLILTLKRPRIYRAHHFHGFINIECYFESSIQQWSQQIAERPNFTHKASFEFERVERN